VIHDIIGQNVKGIPNEYFVLKDKGFYEGLIALTDEGGPFDFWQVELDIIEVTHPSEPSKKISIGFNGEFDDVLKNNRLKITGLRYEILNAYNSYFKEPPESLDRILKNLPDYFFVLQDEDNTKTARLLRNRDVDAYLGIRIKGGIVELGFIDTKFYSSEPGIFVVFGNSVGIVESSGVINIDYSGQTLMQEVKDHLDAIDGKNLFEMAYSFNPSSSIGFSKIDQSGIPIGVLGVST